MKTSKELYALTVSQLESEYNRLGRGKQRTKYGKRVWGHISMKQKTNTRNPEHALINVPVSVIKMYKKNSKFLMGRKNAWMFVAGVSGKGRGRAETLTPYGALQKRKHLKAIAHS